ncbi:GNAT family N-acetyltransferase [Streptomyces sp. NPDC087270]|uniref:GNAT family N-acetyltransferase n=1 Tax=Streptomyces sp. NPDC087270 TaxID=3365774 RepID=UPI003813F40D
MSTDAVARSAGGNRTADGTVTGPATDRTAADSAAGQTRRPADSAADHAPRPADSAAGWSLRPATPADVETVAELKVAVMRADLERLGRYDDHRARQRVRDGFSQKHTSLITVGSDVAGSVTFRPADDGSRVLEHFYLAHRHQGRGLGTAVLRSLLARADEEGVTTRLIVLQGSGARRLYERHGFTVESEDPIDVFMIRPPALSGAGLPSKG